MDVNVGSFWDPPEYPGLAHFLEHLLFMGSEKYPDEAEYRAFMSEHSGFGNAYTAKENTVFFFSINADFLQPALDRYVVALMNLDLLNFSFSPCFPPLVWNENEMPSILNFFFISIMTSGGTLMCRASYPTTPIPFTNLTLGTRKHSLEGMGPTFAMVSDAAFLIFRGHKVL